MLSSDSHAYSCFCTLCISVTIRLVRIAETFVCDICGEDIEKVRYNCNKCDDYDICEPCYFRRTDDDEDDEEAEVPKHPHKLTAIKLPVKAALMFCSSLIHWEYCLRRQLCVCIARESRPQGKQNRRCFIFDRIATSKQGNSAPSTFVF